MQSLLLLNLTQGESMRLQAALHHDQTQANYLQIHSLVEKKKMELDWMKNVVNMTDKWYSYLHLQVIHWCRSKYFAV